MRVALSMRVMAEVKYIELRDSISHDWLREAMAHDFLPLLMPNITSAPEQYLQDLRPDLLILTGGGASGEHEERDRTEDILFQYALENDLPVLGVCRGLQRINEILGGTLTPVDGHVRGEHTISFQPEWHDIYGQTATVNSYHNTSIRADGMASTLRCAGTDPDGLIEAVYMPGKSVAGIMWHPERSGSPRADWSLMRRLVTGEAF
jgi:putative glutamine amidotransferase